LASKFQLITELYNSTLLRVTGSHERWTGFLRAACYNYKCSFDEQILIYAQRPDATAVLKLEDWNEMFGRWVNKGATGIAVFDDASGRGRLKHYFDVSDTHETMRSRRPVPIWEMDAAFTGRVIETLENTFGALVEKDTLVNAVLSASHNAVADNLPDYLRDLRDCREDSLLEELDDLNVEVSYRRALESSIAYMMLTRLSIPADAYLMPEDFTAVYEFNTPATINALGIATSDIAEMGLREVSRTVMQARREQFFAMDSQISYDTAKETSDADDERSDDDGDHIQDAGRISDAELADAAGAGGPSGQVRGAAPAISDEAPQGTLHQSENQLPPDGASGGDRAERENDGGADRSEDGADGRRDGTDEGNRPDALDGPDEQSPAQRGGTGLERPDLQLNTDKTTEAGSDTDSLPAFLDAHLMEAVVLDEGGRKVKRQEIFNYFQSHKSYDERRAFIENAYTDTFVEILTDGVRIGYHKQDDGLLMWEGSYLSRTSETVFSWGVITEMTENLIERGEYKIKLGLQNAPTMVQQLTLFDMGGMGETVPAYTAEESQQSFFPAQTVPQAVIDKALYTAGNEPGSAYRVAAFYMRERPEKENTDFLKREFGTENGRGIEHEGRKYAVWFMEDGIHLAQGNSIRTGVARTTVTWEQASAQILELLNEGIYLSPAELEQAPDKAMGYMADALLMTARDVTEEARATGLFAQTLAIHNQPKGYPDLEKDVVAFAKSEGGLETLAKEYHAFLYAYYDNPNIMRFRLSDYNTHRIGVVLNGIVYSQRHFTAQPDFMRQCKMFITQDEIDRFFLRGGVDGNLAVYSHFCYPHTPDERQKFIKDYYGEYSGGACGGYSHTKTRKGLVYEREYERKQYDTVQLTIPKVVKQYERLIAQKRFPGEDAIAHIAEYEAKQLARTIYNGFYNVPDSIPRPYSDGKDFYGAVPIIQEQLSDPAKVREVLDSLHAAVDGTREDDRYYEGRKKALTQLSEYAEGTFSLFNHRHDTQRTRSADEHSLEKQVMPDAAETATDEPEQDDRFQLIETDDGYAVWDNLRDEIYVDDEGVSEEFDSEWQAENYLAQVRKAVSEKDAPETILYSEIASEFVKSQPDFKDAALPVYTSDTGKRFVFGYGRLGNGTTVWNYLEEENGDYKTVAHIDDDDKVTIYDETMPDIAKAALENRQAEIESSADPKTEGPPALAPSSTEAKEAYREAKSGHPDHLVGIHLGANYEFYGDDAAAVAEVLHSNILERDGTPVSGFPEEIWRSRTKELCAVGHDVLLIGQNDSGEYEIVKERLARDHVPIGTRLTIEGRRFVVDSVDFTFGQVSLRDVTFENGTGFPIFRKEPIEYVRSYIDEPEKDTNVVFPEKTVAFYPAEENNLPYDIEIRTLHIGEPEKEAPEPHLPPVPKKKEPMDATAPLYRDGINYRINDDALGAGTPSERYANNVAAIRTLHEVESENRTATAQEQEILARYVGWGGLADCFDERNSRYQELKSLLSETEYSAARESTLTAFYTPPVVIRSMYQALSQLGYAQGNILEPACGTGNFFGLLPGSMAGSKLYGVELDDLSGRIARQLYQRSSVSIRGYEKMDYPDNFFDVAVGNVPFGQFKVADRRYDRLNLPIHEYFIAKTLDKVRPGGVIAFVTSSFTMDKRTGSARKYIAQRAELLGAIRLPNTTFKAAAGTEVTSDILFLQKRDRMVDIEPEWVHLATDDNGIQMNSYFAGHPDMILGEMKMVSGPYGPTPTCEPYPEQDLGTLLENAIQNINGEITEYDREDDLGGEDRSIEADPTVRNFSFTLVNGQIYYRENSRMNPVEVSKTAESRIRGMIELRDCVRTLLEYQTEDYPENEIKDQQAKLNRLYDRFTKDYGLINSRGNAIAFDQDSSYFLLCSLEVLDEDRNLKRKADLFTKRTIRSHKPAEKVDTAVEALALSIGEKARVDMEYMGQLTGKDEETLFSELAGVVFLNPEYVEGVNEKYLPADEYLSGNVRSKLAFAKEKAANDPQFQPNADALSQVQPTDLTASEISVRLGATWLKPDYYRQFIFETLGTPRSAQWNIKVHYSQVTGEWRIEGKNNDRGNVKAFNTYGTKRANAYEIIEDSLNLKDVRIFDYQYEADGRRTAVLNKKETAIAQSKQELLKEAFAEWLWKDPDRREVVCKAYNILFNSNRPREYDGSHINFSGMNPEITLRKHQVNAIAHIMYGGNTLLAHVVGAGKTFEMVAAAMESKRLGLCQKSLFVVPNHLTEQWATEFLQLYPAANILVATRKDFETKNRKRFCGRIATGEYDAVIIGHSQFEKIPMSVERQRAILEQQMDEILMGINEAKSEKAENFTIKQMEKTRKGLQIKIDKLNDQSRKDDVVTFEELGVDRIFIDESHYFKNLFLYTKMRNVGGIAQTEAQKSSDLFMKCRYLDEITGGRGIVFATGTPISNSMVELYTIQRYLQMSALQEMKLQHFDSWAANYGETVTAIELSPEGTGYRAKTRFAKFYNLPELMSMFKNVADIQTSDMLMLPVPEAHYHNVALPPSEYQKEMVGSLAERAEKVRNREVDSSVDNMLLITNDGRKLALDQRLINPMLPNDPGSKAAKCAENVFEIWQRTADKRSTQMIFCDLSTPKGDGTFSVYDDIRDKLLELGIPENEIAYIHNAKSETQKKDLFGKVRSGQVRVILGSTQRMGAGTNVQQRLVALHHVDCPWRPSDLQQREGRIIRQGNENPEVDIYSYVTEGTFDAYLYQLVESKQKFIAQIMTSKSPVRSAEDVDKTALSYAEIKALASGNPMIKEKMDLDIEVSKLKLLKSSHLSQRYALEDAISKSYPREIAEQQARIAGYRADITTVTGNTHPNAEGFSPMTLAGTTYAEKKEAGAALLALCQNMLTPEATQVGVYRGLTLELSFDSFKQEYRLTMIGQLRHPVTMGTDVFGNLQRMDNYLETLPIKEQTCRERLSDLETQLATAKTEVQQPFPRDEELKAKTARLEELNALLNMDKKEPEIMDEEPDENVRAPSRPSPQMER